jgi:hypothetical protein
VSLEFKEDSTLTLRYLDLNLEEYFARDISYKFDHLPSNIRLYRLYLENNKIAVLNKRNDFFPKNNYEYYLFNLSDSNYRRVPFQESFYIDFIPIKQGASADTLYFLRGYVMGTGNKTKGLVELYMSSENNKVELIKQWRPIDTTRTIAFLDVVSLADGKEVVFCSEGALVVDPVTKKIKDIDGQARAQSMWLLSPESLDISSSIIEEEIPAPVSIFPNPTSNMLHIRSIYDFTIIEVYTVLGHKVANYPIRDNQVNVSSLPTGVYVLKLTDDFGRQFVEKISKID